MRMWMIDPKLMCIQHINGEHNEIHKHRHNFVNKDSIKGRIIPVVQIEPQSMKKRHDELANFLNHKSEYEQPDVSYLPKKFQEAKVDINESIKELKRRCPECRRIIEKNENKKRNNCSN